MKKFFYRFSVREKLMVLLLVFAVLVFWGSMLFKSYKSVKKEFDIVKAQASYQELWLGSEQHVKENLRAALVLMDPKETYSRGEFIGRVDALARASGVAYDINNPSTKTDDVFDEHSLAVQFRDASIKSLLDFDNAISSEAPYLTFKSVELSPNARNPLQLRAKFEVTAIELKNFKGLETEKDENK